MSACDVLVVGAGPTGLITAIELARRGTDIRIVDAVPPRPYAESRAEGVHARTLEALERIGLLEQVLEQGRVLAGFRFHAGGHRLGDLSAAGLDSPHAYSVLLPQSALEQILLQHLATLGVTVLRPAEVVTVTPTPDHVSIVIRTPDGHDDTVAARYVVAADGAHSTVRAQLGIPFTGSRMQGAYVMDGEADFATPPPAERGTFVLGRGGFLVVGHRPDGTYRIALSLPERDPRASGSRPDRAELQALLDRFPEFGVTLRSVTWSSTFFLSARVVDRLRHGRILLAGDAAHIHSPVGGQGMNTGIGDGLNLGWKLALVCSGQARDALLDSYDDERLPIARRLIATTTASTAPLLWHGRIAGPARNTALRALLAVPALQTALFDSFTGFTVRYPHSPLTQPDTGNGMRGGPRPGDRAPEAPGAGERWYRRWGADPRHQLLVFTGPDHDHHAGLDRAARHHDLVRPLLVTAQRRPGGPDTVPDPTGALHRRYRATGGGVYLVRPDGHIAARGRDHAPVEDYLDRLRRPATTPVRHDQQLP